MQREMRAAGDRGKPAGAAPPPLRCLVALSFGPSSTALLHILHESLLRHNDEQQGQGQAQEKKKKGKGTGQKQPRFELDVVHVVFDAVDDASSDVQGSGGGGGGGYEATERYKQEQDLLDRYRTRFPGLEIRTVGLSSIVGSPGIDWSALPLTSPLLTTTTTTTTTITTTTTKAHQLALSTRQQRRQQLAEIFARLPSATSRADVRRLLTRHALLAAAAAADKHSDVVLLGHSTTALAELTLGEAAKGRGFSLPWLVNDGAAFPVPVIVPSGGDRGKTAAEEEEPEEGEEDKGEETTTKMVPVYYPLREIFRKELLSYGANTTPPLTELLSTNSSNNNNSSIAPNGNHSNGNSSSSSSSSGAVVSHKDLSIDDVMARYFGEVEMSYPSVVANVVRTTGKLNRTDDAGGGGDGGGVGKTGRCGLCGITLDAFGDERWRGEIGEESSDKAARERSKGLCYGCERSTRA